MFDLFSAFSGMFGAAGASTDTSSSGASSARESTGGSKESVRSAQSSADKERSSKREERKSERTVKVAKKSEKSERKEPVLDFGGLTDDQKKALELMASGQNVFLTGGAGTGKSFLLRRFLQGREDVLITAPTGVAARNIGGATLHRTFRLPIGIISDDVATGADDKDTLFALRKRHAVIRKCSTLVIDEISMCRADMFACIGDLLLEEHRRGHKIQLVVCGDFAQLPPVLNKSEEQIFARLFPNNPRGWAFLTEQWQALDIKVCELHQIVRQKEPNFAMALGDLRYGYQQALDYINAWHCKSEIKDAVTICGTNKAAAKINDDHLSELPGPAKTYSMFSDGRVNKSDYNCEEELTLKVGARVIILINDTKDDLYQNGSFGVIVSMHRDSVKVKLDDSGEIVEISKHQWEIYTYENQTIEQGLTQIVRKTIGTYSQLPLRLGWAVTIHKSQGATYKAVNLIPNHFWETGQLYVALSRCTSLESLYFPGIINSYNLKTAPEFVNYFSGITD